MKRKTGKFDRAELRKITGEAMKVVRRDFARARKDLDDVERLVAKTLREASAAGRDAAAQGVHATLTSGAMAARVASGMFAGIADTLARKTTRRAR